MASTMETGHSKNVANFDELISSALGFGTDYDPTKEALKILSMQATSALAKKAIAGVNDTLPAQQFILSRIRSGVRYC